MEENIYSSFWLHENKDLTNYKTILELASIRRAISDFVRIVSGKKLLVEFRCGNNTVTDGGRILISADLDKGNIDSTVGLALHEGSHCLLSNFEILGNLKSTINHTIYDKGKNLGLDDDTVFDFFYGIVNWIEDRRVDNYVITVTPGYIGYYNALYNRYFKSDEVTDALISNQFRDETLQSYDFRIINLINPLSDLDALKGLRQISKIIDLDNISRLKSTQDSIALAIEIVNIVFDNIKSVKSKSPDNNSKEKESIDNNDKSNNDSGSGINNNSKEARNNNQNLEGEKKQSIDLNKIGCNNKSNYGDTNVNEKIDGKSIDNNSGYNINNIKKSESIEITPEKFKKVLKDLSKQKNFVNGNPDTKKFDKNINELIKQFEQSGIEIIPTDINESINNKVPSKNNPRKYEVIFIHDISKDLFFSDYFKHHADTKLYEKEVLDGFRLGKMLGRKLQIRNDDKKIVLTRRSNGKISNRLIPELVVLNNTQIFNISYNEKVADAIIHISIDGSASMRGCKFGKAITTSIAIAVAASLTKNINVVISLRGTVYGLNDPLITILYDSRRDNVSKIRNLFPYLDACGRTPEGLCYAALGNEIISSRFGLKSYFINFCDGEPNWDGYQGIKAAYHTQGEVRKLRKRGINIASYFIGSRNKTSEKLFKIMYEKDALFIDVDNIFNVAKTLNKILASDKRIIA